MSKLEAIYDIPPGSFPELAKKISAHLTPEPYKKIAAATQVDLKKVRNNLTDEGLERHVFEIPWYCGAWYARDIGLFQLQTLDEVRDLNEKRYSVPLMSGCKRSYTVELFGKNVNNLGDHPMVVRMDGDFRGHSDRLSLLESWYQAFQEEGVDAMVDGIIDVGVRNQGCSPELDLILAGMPRTSEEFESMIKEEKNRLTLTMLDWAINATRFYWDFFGRPIKEAGHFPRSVTVGGPYNFLYMLPRGDLSKIIKYPTLPKREVIEQIFSGNLEHIVFCE